MIYLQADEIRKTIAQMVEPGAVFECRILLKGKKTLSGYFRDADKLVEELNNHNINYGGATVYIVLQKVNEDCSGREQMDRFLLAATTTSDNDITDYQWLFIDLDPRRPTGTSSTEEQLRKSREVADKVIVYLAQHGWFKPVEAMSGNGWHLHYRVDLPNTQDSRLLMADCLKTLDMLFSDESVAVDTAVFNPSRICKLYGTLAQKGKDTPERPHRMSYIKTEPFRPTVNPATLLEALAKEYRAGERHKDYPRAENGYRTNQDFDVREFLEQHGYGVAKEEEWKGAKKLVLDRCVFDENHKCPDACVVIQQSGAIGYKCLHNSCQGKTWHDVRRLLDPNYQSYEERRAETDRRIEEGWRQHNRNKAIDYGLLDKEPDADGHYFYTAAEILAMPKPNYEYIKTGVEAIDLSVGGLKKGGISVLSGLRASGKSTWLTQVALNAINAGHTVVMYSGELSYFNLMEWMYRQAAGNNGLAEDELKAGHYVVADETKAKIAKWMGDRFYIYNNDMGHDYDKLAKVLIEKVKQTKADLLILDNLMTVDINPEGKGFTDTNANQTRFMMVLKEIARVANVHVLLVAHPRKTATFLRLQDISGTSNIANIVDAAFIMHRRNHDFEKGFGEEFKGSNPQRELSVKGGENYTNVIEVAKDRENGTQDKFVPLWYDVATKQLRDKPNPPGENRSVIYGWREVAE